ncbi:hypothetical protein LTR97_012555 [Elasticomyces elasticus]|uniref:Uncharacterized protein n=1 Tax=Elasticomyces elasticus TaxID=574655 RepID=A0AAN7VVP4_9PEZI|nr:hypothetical protein LTR97_012555 [Elasticomyces elasticus]
MGSRNNVSHMGSQPYGQVTEPTMPYGSYPSPVQRYAEPGPYHYHGFNQGESLCDRQPTTQHDQQNVSPYCNGTTSPIDAPLAIDPVLLQLDIWPSYAQAAQLPTHRFAVYQPSRPMNKLSPRSSAIQPALSSHVDHSQRLPVQLSMHGQPAILLPRHVQHAQANVLLGDYLLPTSVDAPPYRAGQRNDVQPRMQSLVPMYRTGSGTGSSTTSGRRPKYEILSSSSITSAAFMANAITIARYVAKASCTRRMSSAMFATHMTLHVHTSARGLLADILLRASSVERT